MALMPETSQRNATLLEQLKQVGMTYVTQRYLWIGIVFFGLMVVPMMLTSSMQRGKPDAARPMLFVVGMPMLALVPFLVGLAKSQLAHARARLTPQFLPAHLIVLGGVLLTLLVLLPLGTAQMAGFTPWGVLALAVAIGVPALWGAHLNHFAPILVSLGVFYSLLTNWGLDWWIVKSPEHVGIQAAIIALGAFLVIAWLWRMSALREEMDDYQNVYQLILSRRTGTEAVEQRRIVATQIGRNRLVGPVGDWWHARLGGYYGGSRAGLTRLLKYGFQAAPTEVQGLIIVAMMLCMGIFFSQFSILPRGGLGMGSGFFMVQFGIIMPGYMAGEMLAQRRPRIANEMLLPLSRAQLIDGLFAASARISITLWLMMNVALGIIVAMIDQPITLRMAATFLLLSGATMLAAMATSLRISVWPSMAKRLMVVWVIWMMLMPPVTFWVALREKIGDTPFIAAAIVLVGVGAWAICSARRAWLNLEFV